MLLSDLMRAHVVDAEGSPCGRVEDVLFVQDGPLVGAFGARLRLEGLTLGRRSLGVRLGFHRSNMRGPVVLKQLLEWLDRRAKYARWDDVESFESGVVRLRCAVAELGAPPAG